MGALSWACGRLRGWVADAATRLRQMGALNRARVCFPKASRWYTMSPEGMETIHGVGEVLGSCSHHG